MGDVAVYVHLPFCKSRCLYCDFFSTAAQSVPFERYGPALAAEWSLRRAAVPPSAGLSSVYIGGGTPSLWPAEALKTVLEGFGLKGDEEVTVEVNPRDADAAWFDRLVRAGANRFSVGVQSMDDARLRFFGRTHTATDGEAAVRAALASGARSVSADLIFGTPSHRLKDWRREIDALADLGVHHISAYQLTVAEGTPLFARQAQGEVVCASEDETARLFRATRASLANRGFKQYEVSNFARGASHRSAHNRHYWQGGVYLGLGAGAHGFLREGGDLVRYANAEDVASYLAAAEGSSPSPREALGAGGFTEVLSETDHARERLMLGLRTVEGVCFEETLARVPRALQEKWRREATRLVAQNLVRFRNGRLAPTAAGLIYADGLAERFF